MSAFVVSHSHIDALLSYSIDKRLTYWTGAEHIQITDANATVIGKLLLEANEASVLHRYPDATPETCPGTEGETFEKYRFTRWWDTLTAVQMMKACDCLDYQCCEVDDWKQTVAYGIVESIRNEAIRNLPGYSAAAWHMDRAPTNAPRLAL